MNTRNAELFHYGVKGMKWGVRRQAKKDYKSAKKQAADNFRSNIERSMRPLNGKIEALDKGEISRTDFEKINAKFTKKLAKATERFRVAQAQAKRDYDLARGKNEKRVNKRYEKSVAKARRIASNDWQYYVDSIAREYPSVAQNLARAGAISYDDLNRANEKIKSDVRRMSQELEYYRRMSN